VPTYPIGEDLWVCDSDLENRTDVFSTYDGKQGFFAILCGQ